MRKILFIFCLTTLYAFVHAQSDLYLKIITIISKTNPEIITTNKLIAYNVWSVSNGESREANKSFEKVYKTYEYAKLKGGLKGIVVVAINKDDLSTTANITYNKDGITKMISLKLEDFKGIESGLTTNAVFDSKGNEIYENLGASQIFNSINKLVTR